MFVISTGPVYDNCSCDPHAEIPANKVDLPDWCYSPDGTSCLWYTSCLEVID